MSNIVSPKATKKLPNVLSPEEIESIKAQLAMKNFKELLDLDSFSSLIQNGADNFNDIAKNLKINIPNRILLVAEALRKKFTTSKIHKLSGIDPWFIDQIKEIVDTEGFLRLSNERSLS